MLARCSDNKLKNAQEKHLSKYRVWYNKCYEKKNMCVITLVIFYDNITTNSTKLFRVLSCVLYFVINNYVCIDYICCQYKTISEI